MNRALPLLLRRRPSTAASLVGAALLLAACGDDTTGAGGSGGADGSGGAASTASSTSAPSSVASTTATTTTGETTGTTTGAGGTGGGTEFIPTPESIDFAALGPLPGGEQILFNDWNTSPNTVATMDAAGGAATLVFEAYRVWSMGVSADGGTVAFASGDPLQEEHYGTVLGDSIQHTFLYDAATEEASALTWGNINDECHHFSEDGARLYLCRRSDFRMEGDNFVNEGYRIGRVDLATKAFEFLLPPDDQVFVFGAQPTADETTALVQWIDLPSSRSIRRVTLATGAVETLRDAAGPPTRSPDGASYLFADYADGGTLWSAREDGSEEHLVANRQVTNARYSPDGTEVIYLLWDNDAVCSHVEKVAADGSDADAPTRIRDCSETGEFISDLAWIVRD